MSSIDRALLAVGFLIIMLALAVNMERNGQFAQDLKRIQCLDLTVNGLLLDATLHGKQAEDIVNQVEVLYADMCGGINTGG